MSNIQNAFNSLKQDHSPDALLVWSDFFKEQSLDKMASTLLWCKAKEKWPALDDWNSAEPWYFSSPISGVDQQLYRNSHWVLPYKTFHRLDRTRGYVGVRNYARMEYALKDLCSALHVPCEKCRGSCITFKVDHDNPSSALARVCKACKGTGMEPLE